MYSKLNIKDIIVGHKATLDNKNWLEFVLIPSLASLILIIIKVPDNDVKNIFGICLSILVGLYLNILVLLISSISSDNLKIATSHKQIRLELLNETLYNVSFSVFTSVKALIILFLSSILSIKVDPVDDILLVLTNYDLAHLIQALLGFGLYLYTIHIFLVLFMILKRINSIFTKEIFIERIRLNEIESQETDE